MPADRTLGARRSGVLLLAASIPCARNKRGVTYTLVRKMAIAFLVFALAFQVSLGCGYVRVAAANDGDCCATKCPMPSTQHANDCCQVSISTESALAHPAAVQVPDITAVAVRADATITVPSLAAPFACSIWRSPAPPPPLIAFLCSRQI